jgi:hypothetical protein
VPRQHRRKSSGPRSMGTSRKGAQRAQAIIGRRRWRLPRPCNLGECVCAVLQSISDLYVKESSAIQATRMEKLAIMICVQQGFFLVTDRMTISIQQPLTRVFLVDGYGEKSHTILSSQLEREGFLFTLLQQHPQRKSELALLAGGSSRGGRHFLHGRQHADAGPPRRSASYAQSRQRDSNSVAARGAEAYRGGYRRGARRGEPSDLAVPVGTTGDSGAGKMRGRQSGCNRRMGYWPSHA